MGPVKVLTSRRCIYESTFPADVATCALPDGRRLRLFCKHAPASPPGSHGQKRGVAYEASVYRNVLCGTEQPVPRYFGSATGEGADESWLVLEYLHGAERVQRVPGGVVEAARWLGRFHREQSRRGPVPGLQTYDRDYYLAWARRAPALAASLEVRYPWFPALCHRFGAFVEFLLGSEPTVVHGEFYPANVLAWNGIVYPVDWESAAVGAGEIDLAALTEGWSEPVTRECEAAYRAARWEEAAPAGFGRTMDAARAYVCLRWLGDHEDLTVDTKSSGYFDTLAGIGTRWGLTGGPGSG